MFYASFYDILSTIFKENYNKNRLILEMEQVKENDN